MLALKTASPFGWVGSVRLCVQEAYRMPAEVKSTSTKTSDNQTRARDALMQVIMPPRMRMGRGTARRRSVK